MLLEVLVVEQSCVITEIFQSAFSGFLPPFNHAFSKNLASRCRS